MISCHSSPVALSRLSPRRPSPSCSSPGAPPARPRRPPQDRTTATRPPPMSTAVGQDEQPAPRRPGPGSTTSSAERVRCPRMSASSSATVGSPRRAAATTSATSTASRPSRTRSASGTGTGHWCSSGTGRRSWTRCGASGCSTSGRRRSAPRSPGSWGAGRPVRDRRLRRGGVRQPGLLQPVHGYADPRRQPAFAALPRERAHHGRLAIAQKNWARVGRHGGRLRLRRRRGVRAVPRVRQLRRGVRSARAGGRVRRRATVRRAPPGGVCARGIGRGRDRALSTPDNPGLHLSPAEPAPIGRLERRRAGQGLPIPTNRSPLPLFPQSLDVLEESGTTGRRQVVGRKGARDGCPG